MDLTPLLDLLRAVPVFEHRVAIATSLSTAVAAMQPYKQTPVAILYGLQEEAGPNARINAAPLHQVKVRIGLLIVCRNVSDPYGAAASQALDTARRGALQALLGANPDPAAAPDYPYFPLEYKGGSLALADAGLLCWLDTYETEYYLTKEPTP